MLICIVLKRETIYRAIVGGINIQKKFSYAIAAIAAIAIIIVSVFAGLNWGGYDATPTNEPTPTSEATPEPTPIQMTEITYLLGWKNTLQNYAGFYVAMNKGYYAEAGIELTLVEGLGTVAGAQQLAAGKVDFAELSSITLMTSVAQGMNLKIIAAGYQTSPAGFFSLDQSIKTPKDWEGKKVGVAVSSGSYIDYRAVCEAAGVDRAKVEEINTDYAQYVTMASGKIDVTAGTYISDMVALADMGYPNGTKSWYLRASDYGVNSHTSCIGVRADWIQDPNNADVAKRFVQATAKGFEYAFTHIGEALDIFMTYYPDRNRDQEYRLASVSITQCENTTIIWEHGWGWIQSGIMEESSANLFNYNMTSTKVNVAEGTTWTNEFVTAAYGANR